MASARWKRRGNRNRKVFFRWNHTLLNREFPKEGCPPPRCDLVPGVWKETIAFISFFRFSFLCLPLYSSM